MKNNQKSIEGADNDDGDNPDDYPNLLMVLMTTTMMIAMITQDKVHRKKNQRTIDR